MTISADSFFKNHLDPMWVFEVESLRILDANSAACTRFGFSRKELLEMTIADLRPPEDLHALRESLGQSGDGTQKAGTWRLMTKSGHTGHFSITWHATTHRQRPAKLAHLRDVSDLVELRDENARLLAREREERLRLAEDAALFSSLFDAVPGKYLVLDADDLSIVAVNSAFLEITGRQKSDLVGQHLFDVFSGTADEGDGNTLELRHSFERVRDSGVPDILPAHRYSIRPPDAPSDTLDTRSWNVVNVPVRDGEGRVRYIIKRVEDVSDLVLGGPLSGEPESEEDDSGRSQSHADVVLRAWELKRANTALQEKEANLRTVQRLLGLGIWRLDLETHEMEWDPRVYEIFGLEPAEFSPNLNAFMDRIHPDDRDNAKAAFSEFVNSGRPLFEGLERFLRPDGTVILARSVGERMTINGRAILTGVVQDVTRQHEAADELSRTSDLLRIAGRVAKLGGWSVDFVTQRIYWSKQTRAIHEVSPGQEPTLEEAINFYVPEDRARIRSAVEACRDNGIPFEGTFQIRTAKDNLRWVQVVGEAIRDEASRIVGMQGAFQDVSELETNRQRADKLSRNIIETLENISDAVFSLDHDWRFSYLNSQAEKLLQRSRGSLIGKLVWDEFPEAMGSSFQVEYERAVQEQTTVRFTEYYGPLDTWFQVSAYPSPDGLAVYFRDITQERADQTQLRLLELAVERMNDILMITEAEPVDAPEGPKILYVNDAFERLTGYTREDVIGKTPRILQGPKTQQSELRKIGQALRARKPVDAELINYTKKGEEFWLDLKIFPLADEIGRLTHFVSVERDITERKISEEFLRASEERFRMATRAAKDVIWDWDLESNTVWWSDSMSLEFGHPFGDEATDLQFWIDHMHPDDRERVVGNSLSNIADGASDYHSEYRLRKADGDYALVIDRGYVMRDANGKAVRALGSISDITREREHEARERQSQRLEAVGQLTGGVAHDFNNLLTIILGNAELLEERLIGQPDLRQMAEVTVTAAERGAELTNRLLAFSRQQPLEPRHVNLNNLLGKLDGMLRRVLAEDMEIELVRGGGLWTAELDPGQLEVALINLAVNARDAMPSGGKLTIETSNAHLDQDYAEQHQDVEPGQYVLISVSDTGIGMPPEILDRVFEPFFTTKAEGKGSGLGLSMVYGFVKQSGGHIKVYSEVEQGTTIRAYFPRAKVDQPDPPEKETGDSPQGQSEHVLVVEDDALVREHVTSLIKGLGYRVTAASDGPEALACIRSIRDIDLMFTDVVMPGGMDGRQLAAAAAEVRPDLRVLFTSGYTENAIVHHGRLDPGVQLLSKPFRRHDLARKLRRMFEDGKP